MVATLDAALADEVLRKRLGIGAVEHAARFSWDATDRGALAVLAAESLNRRPG